MSGATIDPFALLGLPRAYRLDAGQLQSAYLRRSAALHPDRISDPLLQAEAARQAAMINDARAILGDDESRANALLSLLGGPAKEQDKSLPGGFLIEMMQVREDMESVLASDGPAERSRLEQWAQSRRDEYSQHVGALFENALRAPEAETLREIRRTLNAWRYIERMIEQLGE
jgi:molecular chaperone HscB